jgi:hypothetical protein
MSSSTALDTAVEPPDRAPVTVGPTSVRWSPMLTEFLLMMMLGALLSLCGASVGVALMVRAVAIRNRVHPAIETGAPLSWGYSLRAEARLHRRLQRAVLPLHRPAPHHRPPDDATAELVDVLVGQAVAMDRELLAIARLAGVPRRNQLRRLRAEVRQLELLSWRLQHQRAVVRSSGPGGETERRAALDDLRERLDLLDHAHAELRAIEQATASADPDEVLRRIAPPPPAEPVLPPPPSRRGRQDHPVPRPAPPHTDR